MAGERTLPGIGLKGFWDLGSAYKADMDTNLRSLSLHTQPFVLDSVGTEPGTPTDGEIYRATAAWGGAADGDIVIRDNGAWVAFTPSEGWEFYDRTADAKIRFDGAAWQTVAEGGGIADAPSDGSYYARKDGAWASFTPGAGGGSGTATKISIQQAGMSADDTAANYTGFKTIPFDTADTGTFDALGITVAAGVFTIPAALDGMRVRVTLTTRSVNTSGAWQVRLQKNGVTVQGTDHGTGGKTNPDVTVVFAPMIVADGDTLSLDYRTDDTTTDVIAADTFAYFEVIEDASASGGGAAAFTDLTDTPGTLVADKWVKVNSAGDAIELVDAPAGGGGSSTLVGLTDTVLDTILPEHVGRPIGVTQQSPSVQFGVLPELAAIPVAGGVEILAQHDFSATPTTDVTVTDTHLYDEIWIVARNVVGTTGINLQMLPDGVNPATANLERARIYQDGSFATAVSAVAGSQVIFFVADTGDGMNAVAKIRGLKSGLPLVSEKLSSTKAPLYYHNETAISDLVGDVMALKFTSGGANMTAGQVYIVGIRQSAQPIPATFDYVGSPGGAATLARFVLPLDAKIRSGAQGQFKVAANPTSEVVLEIHQNGVSIGTITIPATTGDPVVAVSADTDLSAGDRLTIEATGAGDFTDLFGSLLLEGRG